MSRRRTGTRYVPITISLTPSMINDIEAKLNAKQSRSQWIASAIEVKLSETQLTTAEATDIQLKIALHSRLCDCGGLDTCMVMRDLRRMKRELKDMESC
jgi:hypothetical protein